MNNIYVSWKRLWAFVIDSIILIILGAILCNVFYNQLLSMGDWAVLVGFTIFVLYYGLQNSALCKGQTIGKRLFKIKVVSETGQYLNPTQSLLRSLILTPMLIFNNIVLPIGYVSMVWSVIIAGLTLIQVVLFFANKPSRQLLHDLIIRSVCISANAEIQNVEKNKAKLAWAIGVPILIGLVGFLPICNLTVKMLGMSMQELGSLQQTVKQSANAKLVGIHANYNKNFNTNEVKSAISYAIAIPKVNIKDEKLCTDSMARVVSALSKSNDKVKEFNVIGVSVVQTINTGLFRFSRNYSQSGSWQQWEDYIKNNNIN